MSRIRRLGVAAIMTAAMLVVGAPAFATEPLTTSTSITDPEGWLDKENRARIDDYIHRAAVQVFEVRVAIVPIFSDVIPPDWCSRSLANSADSVSDILYVVAYEERSDVYCTHGNPTQNYLLTIAHKAAQRAFKTDPLTPEDAAQAAVSFITDLQNMKYGEYADRAELKAASQRSASSKTAASDDYEPVVSIVILLILTGAATVWGLSRRRAQPEKADDTSEVSTPLHAPVRRDTLRAATEARRRLSEAEEQVRAAEEDWNFARAQFGSAAAEQYGRRLEAAKEAIARGLDTHKQIEQTPDSHAKRRLATTITEDLDKNLAPLQDARKEFAAQREKRSSLPAQLADARERLVEELADLERSKEELSSIAGLYPASMLASLQDNPQRAEQLLESARAALETAGAHIDTDATRAASALDTAQRALTMANAQTEAIFSAKTDLDAFRERLISSIGSVSATLTDVKQLDSSDAFSPLLDEAEAAITRGQRALVSDEDPLGALENLRDVQLRLEAVLAPLMTQERTQRTARDNAQRDIRDADAALTSARRYLKDHEGSALFDVGKLMREAEQAMAEAREALDEDPLQASAAASRATTLAQRALAAPGRR